MAILASYRRTRCASHFCEIDHSVRQQTIGFLAWEVCKAAFASDLTVTEVAMGVGTDIH